MNICFFTFSSHWELGFTLHRSGQSERPTHSSKSHTHLLENAVTTSTDQKKALQDSGAVRTKVHTITTSTDQKNALQDSGAVRTKVMSHSAWSHIYTGLLHTS